MDSERRLQQLAPFDTTLKKFDQPLARQLTSMQDVSNAYLTFGAYDVIAEIQTENQEGFEKAIATIRKLSRVVSTMTLNVIVPE